MNVRRVVPWLLVGLAVIVAALVMGGSEGSTPLDPTSNGPTGTSGLVALLRQRGASVDLTSDVPTARDGRLVTLVLRDDLTNPQRDQLLTWVEAGGLLVVADPASSLHGGPSTDGGSQTIAPGEVERGTCSVTPLRPLRTIDPDGGLAYVLAPGTGSCFGDGRYAFVITTRQGTGTVVALGGSGPLQNSRLALADNAPMATAILAPVPGGRVVVLQRARAGAGREGLLGLISPKVLQAFAALAVAFVVVALWRMRRLGAPVAEVPLVAVDGSELVVATAALLQRSHRADEAARLLRAEARRDLAASVGVPADAPTAELVDALAARGVDPDRARSALDGPPPTSDRALVAVASALDDLRRDAR